MKSFSEGETPSPTSHSAHGVGQEGATGSLELDLVHSFFKTPIPVSETNSETIPSRYEGFDSSTAQFTDLRGIEQRVCTIFADAEEQVFEDGIESDFSRELLALISLYGRVAIDPIVRLIISESANKEIAAEALRAIGRIRQSSTHRDRLWLLEHGLYSSSARVRDGATLGLAYLDDPVAVIPLKLAIEREQIPELREDMQQVLDQLGETVRWHSS